MDAKQHDETRDDIIKTIESEDSINLPLFRASILKEKYPLAKYIEDKVIGFYMYQWLDKKHCIRNILDGIWYEIHFETLEFCNGEKDENDIHIFNRIVK